MKNQPAAHQPIQSPIWKFIVLGISSGLGLGFLPKAPGTWGSLLGIPLGLFLLTQDRPTSLIICCVLFVIFSWLAARACHHWATWDAQKIVSDEVLGQGIAILGLKRLLEYPDAPFALFVVAAFLLFRVLDIVKPFPAKSFDRMKNGFGVVADDVVAGVYSALILRAAAQLWISGATL
jgi:phosphatidylglycerophosphatase A